MNTQTICILFSVLLVPVNLLCTHWMTQEAVHLTGMTYNQARDTLSYYGIYISTRSNVTDSAAQTVSGQSLPAGTGVDHGCIIEVSLIDQDDSILGRY